MLFAALAYLSYILISEFLWLLVPKTPVMLRGKLSYRKTSDKSDKQKLTPQMLSKTDCIRHASFLGTGFKGMPIPENSSAT
jgi:hypothetical protein